MPSAPLAVSSQPRKKLKTTSQASKSKDYNEDKENAILLDGHDDFDDDADANINDGRSAVDLPFPHTPAVRIPLEDLIGNTEDAFNCPPPLATPRDHVVWHNGPASSDISASVAGTQKSRKRFHSSSPESSQADRASQAAGQGEALDLNGIQRALKTPNNHPTQDLWNRYMSANISRQANGEIILPSFAHLPPSSPQTPSTTSKDGNFRRTVSCGVEWPTSKPKRRKVDAEDVHNRTKNIFAASRRQILAQGLSKTSRVSLLVEKIQESLDQRPQVDDGPSSSSPLPDRHAQIASQTSPTKSPSKLRPHTEPGPVLPNDAAAHAPAGPLNDESSSDFGDDGLDVDFFESVEQTISQVSVSNAARSRAIVAGFDGPASTRTSQRKSQQSLQRRPAEGQQDQRVQKVSPPNAVDEFDDGFDDDDDIFATELEGLAHKVESQDKTESPPVAPRAASLDVLHEVDELEDAFDDDDDELWREVANGGTEAQPGVGSKSQKANTKAIKRYLIRDVHETTYQTAQGKTRPEKLLSVKDERTTKLLIVLLRQSWYDTRCTKGSYVHIIGSFDNSGQCTIDDADGMVVIHPDHLISATVVGDSFTCTRRAALQDRIKATSRATAPQVYGHIIHEMFGEALRLDQWSRESFQAIIGHILPNYLESLYEIGVSEADAAEYLLGKTPDLMGWATLFVRGSIAPDAAIQDRNGGLVPTSISKLLELEEHIWSPMYGLKGNVDATVQVQMHMPADHTEKTLVVPLELKTGKKDNVETHRAQTALYTLLLSDRYDVNVACGVLYYLETSKTFRVQGVRNEIRHMIIERNNLACYVHDKLDLPPMLKKPHLCKACYSKTECFTYHKLIEDGNNETSGLGEVFNELVGHLQPHHAEFFKKWDNLLTKEERDTMKFRRELWTMLSHERQGIGRCFANVVIEPGSAQERPESTKINRFEYTFVKEKHELGFSFTDSQITIGEPIVVSDEAGHFNLASGYVTNVRPTRVVVAVDRRLQNAHRKLPGFDGEKNQVFTGLMESKLDGTSLTPRSASESGPKLYRIDRDEFANGMATARNNVIRIMEKDLYKAKELRQLIVDNMAPAFRPGPQPFTLAGPASQQQINADQKRAIEKVLSAKDYALVLGMPGTGKTTTIAHIIRALVSQNKSVLLASYTHTAVDNILLKIKDDKIPILRVGAVSKVHPDVQGFANLTGVPKKTTEELHRCWQDSKVVATTCLGINHGVFNARTFDYCIVDEASQITLPVCLGPIRHAKTFILVGDHYQLPPLVQNKEAQEGGLNVSLFKLLSDAQPQSVVNLETQYRMAEDIQMLSSKLVYSGRLKCGTTAVASRMLQIPNLEVGLAAHHHTSDSVARSSEGASICVADSSCWIRHAVEPSNRCLFLDTNGLLPQGVATEVVSGSRITNEAESVLTAQIVTTLIRSGVLPASIGVITFYRSQLALMKRDVKLHAGNLAASEIEMHTADKYQGRDKEVIILSCVRSNTDNQIGELLKDWRRVNVAVTRARSKLVIIGSKTTLGGSQVPMLEGIVRLMNERKWILDLPPKALDAHLFQSLPTQTQMTTQGQKASTKSPQTAREPLQRPNRNPLSASSGNASPTKKTSVPGGAFKKPRPKKIVHGKQGQLEKIVEGSVVMQDVIRQQGVMFGGVIESSPALEELDIEL